MSAIDDLLDDWNKHHAELLQWRDEQIDTVPGRARALEFELRANEVSLCIGTLKAVLPPYEYTYAHKDAKEPATYIEERYTSAEEVQHLIDSSHEPERWKIMRRIKQNWEDVK